MQMAGFMPAVCFIMLKPARVLPFSCGIVYNIKLQKEHINHDNISSYS